MTIGGKDALRVITKEWEHLKPKVSGWKPLTPDAQEEIQIAQIRAKPPVSFISEKTWNSIEPIERIVHVFEWLKVAVDIDGGTLKLKALKPKAKTKKKKGEEK